MCPSNFVGSVNTEIAAAPPRIYSFACFKQSSSEEASFPSAGEVFFISAMISKTFNFNLYTGKSNLLSEKLAGRQSARSLLN